MIYRPRRSSLLLSIALCCSILLYLQGHPLLYIRKNATSQANHGISLPAPPADQTQGSNEPAHSDHGDLPDTDLKSFLWSSIRVRYPVTSMRALPTKRPKALPKIQARIPPMSPDKARIQSDRQMAVKDAFTRCWKSYQSLAWMQDELTPLSGSFTNWFGGWAATLVDSLDTLWIMGLRDEFYEAVDAIEQIDFEKTLLDQINTFETNIRYLGGFLAAYDLSGDRRLLDKAKQVGDMLYAAFDTPNRMPVTRWDFNNAARHGEQIADENVLLAEIGSFGLEFIRLSQITGDPKWYDATQRIMEKLEEQQSLTKLPGMWPVLVNARKEDFTQGTTYTLGAMADSLYEYLPKTHALTAGLLPMYQRMYELSMDTAIKNNFYRPMVPNEEDILISGAVHVSEVGDGLRQISIEPSGQHLVCFAGGMLALGGKLFGNETHLETAGKLVDGCIWSYNASRLGIMPEVFYMVPCEDPAHCSWNDTLWRQEVLKRAGLEISDSLADAQAIIDQDRLPVGFASIPDTRYILRPETIESVLVLYRLTGREDLLESAWSMFEAIQKVTRTELANAAVADVTVTDDEPPQMDWMESFWMGETLKYFYLIFSDQDLISLDEYVFNTEAHPLRLPISG